MVRQKVLRKALRCVECRIGYRCISSKQERQGFGSFHSEDIEELIRLPKDQYKPPQIYDPIRQASDTRLAVFYTQTDNIQLGKHLSKSLYHIDPSFVFLNHGAFGAATRIGLQESCVWRELCESQPLRFFDRLLLPMIAYVIRKVAAHFHCPPTELVPLPNVTAGLNAIASSLACELSPADEVVCLSLTYGSTKKILTRLCAEKGCKLVTVAMPLPITSTESMLQALEQQINKHTKLVVLDAITSNTALVLPIVEMATLCKKLGSKDIVVVCDAAHSFFSQEIRIYDEVLPTTQPQPQPPQECYPQSDRIIGIKHQPPQAAQKQQQSLSEVVDVYLTNGHKWLSAPKGCAFMWLSPRIHHKIRPAIISHGFIASTSTSHSPSSSPSSSSNTSNGNVGVHSAVGKLLSAFAWDGCRDYAALLTVPTMLRMWESIDKPVNFYSSAVANCSRDNDMRNNSTNINSSVLKYRTRKYMHETLQAGVEHLTKEWNIRQDRFVGPIETRQFSPMQLVPLPERIRDIDTTANATDKEAFQLQEKLHTVHRIEVPVKCLEGKLYVRVSAHVYNDQSDFVALGEAIKGIASNN